jgi:acetyl esterase/lipase
MTQQQREAIAGMLRTSPFGPAGVLNEQRPLFEKQVTAAPVPGDVVATPGQLAACRSSTSIFPAPRPKASSCSSTADVDPVITAAAPRVRADDYLDGTSACDPAVSPVYGSLAGLPPLLIQAGSHEVLLDDAIRLAARAAYDDVAVTLDVVPGVPHVFQAFAALLDEGDDALSRAGDFLRQHMAPS